MDRHEASLSSQKDEDFAKTSQNPLDRFQNLDIHDPASSPRSNGGSFLNLGEQSLRKSVSFQDITELPDEAPTGDLGRRGSLPQSLPSSPQGGRSAERPQKPWKLRRSSTPVPGSLDVSSILKKARKSFSSGVGNAAVNENDEKED